MLAVEFGYVVPNRNYTPAYKSHLQDVTVGNEFPYGRGLVACVSPALCTIFNSKICMKIIICEQACKIDPAQYVSLSFDVACIIIKVDSVIPHRTQNP